MTLKLRLSISQQADFPGPVIASTLAPETVTRETAGEKTGGRKAGAIIGGMFLKQFVTEETPWAHIDIAGVMWAEKELPYCPKGGMGFGARLLLEYLEALK